MKKIRMLTWKLIRFFTGKLSFELWAHMTNTERLNWAMRQRWILLDDGASTSCAIKVRTSEIKSIRPYGAVFFLDYHGRSFYHSNLFPDNHWHARFSSHELFTANYPA